MQLVPQPKVQFFDDNGNPLNGGLVYTYANNTTTPQATYTDSGGGTANANPVVLNARGEANIWYDPTLTYTVTLKTSAGVLIWTVNGVGGSGSTTTLPWAVAAGTADAITASYTPANTTLSDGLLLTFRAASANATTTPTFAPDGLTAHTITRLGGKALVPGDIPGQYAECFIRYNLANTRWELLNPSAISMPWVAAGGTADAITATYSPAIPAVYDGLILGFRATTANLTNAPTFSPNGLTARTITREGGNVLQAGDIPTNLAECFVRYNSANTRWELLNPASGLRLGTAVAATGATVDFTSFPSWSKRVSLLFTGVRSSGTGFAQVLLGGTGTLAVESTGYRSFIEYEAGTSQSGGAIVLGNVSGTSTTGLDGRLTLELMGTSGNTWAAEGVIIDYAQPAMYRVFSSKSVASALGRVRFYSGGTATFTSGTLNTIYE